MPNKNIATYLDAGSIELFAQQIREVLGSVCGIAIHGPDGQLAWNDTVRGGENIWPGSSFLRQKMPGAGFCERLDNGNLAYVFYLHSNDGEEPAATLSVQVNSAYPISFEFAHKEVVPILECIERQITINAELSAVRRLSNEGQRGLELLVRFDELDNSLGSAEQIAEVLRLSAEHFGAEMAAVVLPDSGIQDTWPRSFLEDSNTAHAVGATLGSLLTHAKVSRQILLTDVSPAGGQVGNGSKILSSPIINSKDRVVGIFVLIGGQEYSKDQMRLSRAIATKVNSMARVVKGLADGHYSRHGFLSYVANILRHDPHQQHALLYLDIDKLHVINDKFGHMAGDRVIGEVAGIVEEVGGANVAVSHLNGDNFAMFLRGANDAQASEKANLILDTLASSELQHEGETISASASIGIAMFPEVVTDSAAGLNTAELAARSAQRRGGNRTVLFRDLDASVAQRRSDLDQVNHLQQALIGNRFQLHAQPIAALCADDGRSHFEILVRMTSDDGELLHPGKFLSAAERYQMMSAVDRWVIRHTLDTLSSSEQILEINLSSFNINLSAQSLVADDFVEFVEARIIESGIAADILCFEITETAVVRNLERAQRCIRRLRKLGCRVALDDFGTGYCSFAYLKDLPVHYIKVDGAFVRDLVTNPLSESIVSAMTSIAKVMDASTVAEHVETELVLQKLRQMGVDFVQGFLIGKPRPLIGLLESMGHSEAGENQVETGGLAS